MEVKTYKLWKSRQVVNGTPVWSGQPVFMGKMEGTSFDNAVANYIKELPEQSHQFYTNQNGHWYYASNCRICETYDLAVAFARGTNPTPEVKRISVWRQGYDCTGDVSPAQHMFDADGDNLNDVIKKFVDNITDDSKSNWRFCNERNAWFWWGCKTFDNETDARKAFG